MNVLDALQQLRTGKHARRAAWPIGRFLLAQVRPDSPRGFFETKEIDRIEVAERGVRTGWTPSAEDVAACDWLAVVPMLPPLPTRKPLFAVGVMEDGRYAAIACDASGTGPTPQAALDALRNELFSGLCAAGWNPCEAIESAAAAVVDSPAPGTASGAVAPGLSVGAPRGAPKKNPTKEAVEFFRAVRAALAGQRLTSIVIDGRHYRLVWYRGVAHVVFDGGLASAPAEAPATLAPPDGRQVDAARDFLVRHRAATYKKTNRNWTAAVDVASAAEALLWPAPAPGHGVRFSVGAVLAAAVVLGVRIIPGNHKLGTSPRLGLRLGGAS